MSQIFRRILLGVGHFQTQYTQSTFNDNAHKVHHFAERKTITLHYYGKVKGAILHWSVDGVLISLLQALSSAVRQLSL